MSSSLTIRRLTGPSKGKVETVTSPEAGFGSGPNNTVRFDPSWERGVSPSHARVFRDAAGGWWVEDAGSAGGTWIQGQRVSGRRKAEGSIVLELGSGGPKVEVTFPPPSQSPETGSSGAPSGGGQGKSAKPLVLISLLALLAAGVLWSFWKGQGGQDERLQAAAERNASAVGVVIAVTEEGPEPFATAWAVRENIFATNAHVVVGVARALGAGSEIYITVNRQPRIRLRVVRAEVHPKAGHDQLNAQGKTPAIPPWDIGLLFVEGKAPATLRIADRDKLRALRSGTRVAYLGFPMEGMSGGGVNAYEPVANMQSGIITSVSDFWLGAASPEECLLVSHNLGAAGGASGSPVFNADGEVVAVLSAGNVTGSVIMEGGMARVVRTPSAVMINFAQRADILTELLESGNGR